MFENILADTRRLRDFKTQRAPWYVIESLLFENGYQAVLLHRLAHWLKRRRIPGLGPAVARLSLFLTGVDISPNARIGPALMIGHGVGLVVGGAVRIGARATLMQQATLGSRGGREIDRMPVLGDGVFVGAGARILGDIEIGDGAFIGADAVVTQDIPPAAKVSCEVKLRIALPDEPPA